MSIGSRTQVHMEKAPRAKFITEEITNIYHFFFFLYYVNLNSLLAVKLEINFHRFVAENFFLASPLIRKLNLGDFSDQP